MDAMSFETMSVAVGSATDVGAVRELNEDAVLTAPPIYAVADGMGGHAAGEVAAALALEQLAPLAGREHVHPADVLARIDQANATILACAAVRADAAGMGTTLTGVCLGEVAGSPHWIVFNVGDSRVYSYADDALVQVTTDHSEIEELLQAGKVTPEQARHHPLRNVVTRSLGSHPAPVPDIWVLPARTGDRFVLCSDGLSNEVDDAELASVLADRRSPQATADELVARAVHAGGRDNVSVVIVEVSAAGGSDEIDVSTAPRAQFANGGGA